LRLLLYCQSGKLFHNAQQNNTSLSVMHKELSIKTKTLGGVSDLTLLAPIKPGLIPALDTVTYTTRLKRLLKALHMGRVSTHEYALHRPFSDAVERVGRIHSVRVVVFEPEGQVLLSVTFDGVWETYARVLWQKVGALLDVIFCNTIDYVSARDNSFEAWSAWIARVQRNTDFFYGMPDHTVQDVHYLKDLERIVRDDSTLCQKSARAAVLHELAIEDTTATLNNGSDLVALEIKKQSLQSLASLYKLTELFVPELEDDKFLHRAACEFLREQLPQLNPDLMSLKDPLKKQATWMFRPEVPSLRGQGTSDTHWDLSDQQHEIQGGILHPYSNAVHGQVLLLHFPDTSVAAAVLSDLLEQLTTDEPQDAQNGSPTPFVNVALTEKGLRRLGLTDTHMLWFPAALLEGMDKRASLLGDVLGNHPRRWSLASELPAVHAILQLRSDANDATTQFASMQKELTNRHPGLVVLHVQSMQRHFATPNDTTKTRDHFGFEDIISNEKPSIPLGDILLGYANQADAPGLLTEGLSPEQAKLKVQLLHNGSYLVIRKLKQNTPALRTAVAKASVATGLPEELIYAKMMGRYRDGSSLLDTPPDTPHVVNGANDNYASDLDGLKCPFQSHIRRSNPRLSPSPDEPPGARTPHLVRRSMTYGPALPEGGRESLAEDRGLMFMAYNASISEQFEVIQRWISGGNSTGIHSAQSDPFLGVPKDGQVRQMRFDQAGQQYTIDLDGNRERLVDQQTFVTLDWGLYSFAPSVTALQTLIRIAQQASKIGLFPATTMPWSASKGRQRIEALLAQHHHQTTQEAIASWKALLEDPASQESFEAASVWAAIRRYYGGVLRTPYGVFIADKHEINKALLDTTKTYSTVGYQARLSNSLGCIYLGMDDSIAGCPYRQAAQHPNAAIMAITQQQAYELTFQATQCQLQKIIDDAFPLSPHYTTLQSTVDIKELLDNVLADICEAWFGVQETGGLLQRGGSHWLNPQDDNAKVYYPGSFTAPSRYVFQPHPSDTVAAFGQGYGQQITTALVELLHARKTSAHHPPSPLGDAIMGALDDPSQYEPIASTLAGVMMGFLPTVDGNVRLLLNEWLKDGTFWSLRNQSEQKPCADFTQAMAWFKLPMYQTLQLRPSPELIWRTANKKHQIAGVNIDPDDKVVLALVSATHQSLEEGELDIMPIFGGVRSEAIDMTHGHQPTHACPAYKAATGVIAGFLAALLKCDGALRPSPSGLVFTIELSVNPKP
jgi:Dyp-type peroxidase family